MGKFIQNIDANWKVPYEGGWCLAYVQNAFDTAHWYPSAIDQWYGAAKKHTELPPLGITVPVYFTLGNEPAGHVAIRLDDGMVASSTQGGVHSQGYIHKNIQDMIDMYAKYNGGCTYLGWSEDLADKTLVHYQPEVTTKETTEEEIIPFKSILGVDDTLPKGENYTKKGELGKIIRIFTVTYSDGVEANKVLKSETRLDPVTEEYITGTYELPVKPEKPVVEPVVKPQPTLLELITKLVQLILSLFKKG